MPESTSQNAQEGDLTVGGDVSAAQAVADPITYWQALRADPSFILTGTTAPSYEVALSALLQSVKRAATQDPDRPIILAEGWPALTATPPSHSDLVVWHKKIAVYHAQFLALAAAVQAAFPALDIQAFSLGSALSALLETPAAETLTVTDLFSADAPLGTPALSASAAILTALAGAPAPLDALPEVSQDLPEALADGYPELLKLAYAAVGGVLTALPGERLPDTDPMLITTFVGSDAADLIELTDDLRQIDGGAGRDTLAVDALAETASLTFGADGRLQLDLADTDPVVLSNIERIAFSDGTLAFDVDGLAGQAYRLYQACFDRTPDIEGLGFWIKQLDAQQVSLTDAAELFIGSEEFAEVYGSSDTLADVHYLALLYANVLDRVPDSEGFGFWRDQQQDGVTRADMLVYFSESTENIARVAPAVDDGIWYV